MMKKILIATLIACIMLILPLNNVVGVSEVEDDCNCKPVSNLHLVILERLSNKLDRLLNRLEVYTGMISILYKHKPDVIEEFEELTNKISSLGEINEEFKIDSSFEYPQVICAILIIILATVGEQLLIITEIFNKYPILFTMLIPVAAILTLIFASTFDLYLELECDEFYP